MRHNWKTIGGAVVATVTLSAAVFSVYYAKLSAEAARDAVALQKKMADAERHAARPYLRFVHAKLTDEDMTWMFKPPSFASASWTLPPGRGRSLEIEFLNVGQRAAWGVMGSVNVASRAQATRAAEDLKTSVAATVCPMQSVASDLAPGDSFLLKCMAYVPTHEFVGVRVLYTDTEGGEELCQFTALHIGRDGMVTRTGELGALILAKPDDKCGPHEPEWLKRARVNPTPSPSPGK